MSTKQTELLCKFKVVLLEFIDELVQQFPNDFDIVTCRVFIKDQIPIKIIMDIFIKHFTPYENLINNRDELFFTEGSSEFCKALKLKNNIFEKVWYSNVLDQDDKEIIWEWITSLYKLVTKYKTLDS